VLDAWAWLDADDDEPFTFRAICGVLGLEVSYVRKGLCRFRGGAMAEVPARARRRGQGMTRIGRRHLIAVG
jgi:hypothetical protein